jgi:predicted nuclease of restriction endonuclease-like (RecB) superfamily
VKGAIAEGVSPGLLREIRNLIVEARNRAARSVNSLQVLMSFEIGRRIVEHEQSGKRRAEYGTELLKALSFHLTKEFGKGFSHTNLKLMRQFYLTYQGRIGQKVSDQLPVRVKGRKASDQFSANLLPLSWSHYVFLVGIDNAEERSFYEIEAAENGWSLPEMRRQFDSGLYERLALSRDKEGVKALAAKGQVVAKPEDIVKDPYVLEFLGLDERTRYSESDLEEAIISKIEHFLLELGKGFLFESRQKRFTFDEEHFFVDLVFYNRLLRCYVLIDLKIGKLTHQDLGQMQMYVNYFDRYVKREDENRTVGIVLCKKKHDALVEITLPENANIRASEYRLYLPSKKELKQKLLDWTEGREAGE